MDAGLPTKVDRFLRSHLVVRLCGRVSTMRAFEHDVSHVTHVSVIQCCLILSNLAYRLYR